MREKYLKEPPGWILGTIKRELNLFDLLGNETLEDLQDHHDMALSYWRQNRRQYPPERVCNKFHFNLLYKSFESRHELQALCIARVKQLKDLMYREEQYQQRRRLRRRRG
jgi:hypothetical protein